MTENTKHTPGPWVTKGIFVQGGGSGAYFTIATVSGPSNKTMAAIKELIANARLIAAAPDLLEALEMVINASDADLEASSEEVCDAIDWNMIRNAISRAKGEA